MSDNEMVYTTAEVAEKLKVHPRSVRRWVIAGLLRALALPGRHGGEYRIPESALAEFLSTRQTGPAGDQEGPADD